jgi:hypothetical protein
LIDHHSRDSYTTPSHKAENWIEFSFDEKVRLSSARLTSSDDHFLKSYRLVIIGRRGDEVVFSTHSDEELASEGAQVIRRFSREITAAAFRIEQTGPSWGGGNAFALRNVELMAEGFDPGLFQAKRKSGSADAITVRVGGEGIDPRTGKLNVRTFAGRRQWIELEFTEGRVRIEGFCARRGPRLALKAGDGDPPRWEGIEIEADGSENGLDSFKVVRAVRRCQRVRITLEGPDDGPVELVDFDLFGEYQPRGSGKG